MVTMKNSFTVSTLIAVASVLTGCIPHLNKQQCETMDWHQVGFTDGSQGKSQRDLSPDIQDCAKFQLTVNTKEYARG